MLATNSFVAPAAAALPGWCRMVPKGKPSLLGAVTARSRGLVAFSCLRLRRTDWCPRVVIMAAWSATLLLGGDEHLARRRSRRFRRALLAAPRAIMTASWSIRSAAPASWTTRPQDRRLRPSVAGGGAHARRRHEPGVVLHRHLIILKVIDVIIGLAPPPTASARLDLTDHGERA